MKEIVVEPNLQKWVEIKPGEVGFLWEITSDKPIRCAVDGIPIQTGYFDPPYLLQKGFVLISTERTSVSYNMEIYDDIYEKPEEERIVETEEVRPIKPHIVNHILNEANKWYEIPIPKDIKTWSMNARGDYDLLYSFEPSHSTYRTLFSGNFLDSDTAPRTVTPTSIYVSCDTTGAIVELLIFR